MSDPNKPPRHPALRHRDFNLLAFGRLAGSCGGQMLAVALGWQVYDITHDPFALGMVGLCQFLPAPLLMLHAGQWADKFDRARLSGATYTVVTLCGLALFLLSLLGNQEVWPIYLIATLLGVGRIIGAPASKALLPNLIPAAAFSNAISISSMMFQIATIAGPALGGIAYIFGAPVVYGIATGLIALSTVMNFMIRTRSKGEPQPQSWKNLMAGLHYVLARPILIGSISLDLFAVLFGGIVALLPIYARDILHTGPEGLGMLRAAPAAGAAIMALGLAHFPLRSRVGLWLFGGVGVFGIATIFFGLSESFLLSLTLLIILGAADMISVYVRSHLMQLETPDALRGRVAAVNMLFITSSNELGEFESGVTASWLGVVPATVAGGILTLGVGLLCAWRIPALWKIDKLHIVEK